MIVKTHSTKKDKTPDQTSLKNRFLLKGKVRRFLIWKNSTAMTLTMYPREDMWHSTEKPAPWSSLSKRHCSQRASTFPGLHKVTLFPPFAVNRLYAQRMEVSVPVEFKDSISGLLSSSFSTSCIFLCLCYLPCLCFPECLNLKTGKCCSQPGSWPRATMILQWTHCAYS